MISTSEFFDVLTLDARRWPDHTDYYLHGPTRCALHVPLVLASTSPRLIFRNAKGETLQQIISAFTAPQLQPCGSADFPLTRNTLPDVEPR